MYKETKTIVSKTMNGWTVYAVETDDFIEFWGKKEDNGIAVFFLEGIKTTIDDVTEDDLDYYLSQVESRVDNYEKAVALTADIEMGCFMNKEA